MKVYIVISETRLTVHCTDWRTDPHETERRHDHEAIQAKGDSDIDSDSDSRDVGGDNHVTKVEPGTRSGGVLAMAAVVECVLQWYWYG